MYGKRAEARRDNGRQKDYRKDQQAGPERLVEGNMSRSEIQCGSAVIAKLQTTAGMKLMRSIMKAGRNLCMGKRGIMCRVREASVAYSDPKR